jgi:phosphoribosyl-dephospho-CoA transferase
MQGQTKPEQISKKRTWRSTGQFLSSSILSTLSEASELLENFGLIWGPTGSIGFELASGIATAVASSDVDILIRIPHRFPIAQAQFIRNSLTRMPVVVDVQIETPLGAVALGEYARGSKTILLRTLEGPRLVADPWKDTPDGTGTT